MNENQKKNSFFESPRLLAQSVNDSSWHSKKTLPRDFSSERLRDIQNSASVANCIRSLNLKTSALVTENNDLKKKNSDLAFELRT